MCLLAAAWRVSQRYPLVVAANRDERYARPALAIHWWHDEPDIFGGRDLAAGGSWLAVDRRGRLAAVTNLRDGAEPPAGRRSRGRLVADFLAGRTSAEAFAAAVEPVGDEYGGFNLLLFDGGSLLFTSNRAGRQVLEPGVHAVSNAPFDAAWPKLDTARAGLRAALDLDEPTAALLQVLADPGPVEGGGPQSAVFIAGPEFGTRSSAVILLDRHGRLSFTERRFGPNGMPAGESHHDFEVIR